ncbi:hypothetical protein HWE04_09340 [Herbaspirillum sp. C7C2]|uniref:hypothetical protein n=1 Tax=Herbaspirillum sp. C7C2 TaxID=2736666 RepID=UPI001F51DF0F|nr:hypothetical protein [Herbaspirillum sp. C7C2]MCI1014057.1 hypothetical protein [Herbaspirillum sp. C7C2]
MQADYATILQWIYLFNSLALAQLALKQLGRRRKARQLEQGFRAAQTSDWRATAPDFLFARLGKPHAQVEQDDGSTLQRWRGERHWLDAVYRDGQCQSVEISAHQEESFPTVNTYFNCAVLAALACAWKFSGLADAPELPVAAAAKQYLSNFIVFVAGAWLLSFLLKRQRMLLNLGCIAMVVLALPLLNWP